MRSSDTDHRRLVDVVTQDGRRIINLGVKPVGGSLVAICDSMNCHLRLLVDL
jgi:NADH:ubiquinone oxidoreductase subunit E